MKETTPMQDTTKPRAPRADGTEPGMRLRLPITEGERREADFFMDMPRAGRAERERRARR